MYRSDGEEVARTVTCPRCSAPVTVARDDDTIACGTCDGKFVLPREQGLVRSVDAPSTALATQDRTLLAIGVFVAGGALLAVISPTIGSVVLGVGIAIGLLVRGRKMFAGRR